MADKKKKTKTTRELKKPKKVTKKATKKAARKVQGNDKPVPLLLGILIIIVVAAIAAVLIFFGLETVSGTPIEAGDNITVYYYVETQERDFNNSGEFNFIAGSGQVVDGFDEAVIGMYEGQEKEFTLQPEEAYGEPDSNQTVPWPLFQTTPETVNMTMEDFNATFGETPVVDKTYDAVVYPWEIRVTEVEGDTVWVKHEPEQDQVVQLPYGNSTVRTEDGLLMIYLNPKVGARFTSIYGPYGFPVISEANATHMILDLNHPLAGETLDFEIKILEVIPA